MYHPVTVQNRDHVYPAAAATSTTMDDELLICVSELRYPTNEDPNYLKENTTAKDRRYVGLVGLLSSQVKP